jgi:hypothetical protein
VGQVEALVQAVMVEQEVLVHLAELVVAEAGAATHQLREMVLLAVRSLAAVAEVEAIVALEI